jgi:hypothetical protein
VAEHVTPFGLRSACGNTSTPVVGSIEHATPHMHTTQLPLIMR